MKYGAFVDSLAKELDATPRALTRNSYKKRTHIRAAVRQHPSGLCLRKCPPTLSDHAVEVLKEDALELILDAAAVGSKDASAMVWLLHDIIQNTYKAMRKFEKQKAVSDG